ncbi:MAG: chromosomal replication initiator protein DnaA [Nitrospinota bacterium]|nr:MAG: chromosomal replication initiator protein DnaA [Nitrospinota bacterium]
MDRYNRRGYDVDVTVWRRALELIEEQIGATKFATWFGPIQFLSANGESLTLGVPNTFMKEWLIEHYQPLITDTLYRLTQTRYTLHFHTEIDEALGGDDPYSLDPYPPVSAVWEEREAEEREDAVYNPQMTFENFVVGSCNQFAHAACLAVADRPAQAYNPLFIYGGVGLGKTHLLHSIGNFLKANRPGFKACYVSSEKFLNDLVDALRYDQIMDFRARYRKNDLLMIDDIHFIAGKERTQEEFFHTFNALYEERKQIVLSSDRPPREMATLESRLRSRFEWGLIADLQPPDLETKIAILKKKAEQLKITLSDDLLFLIASNISADVRKLEGALNRLVVHASLTGTHIDDEAARHILKDVLEGSDQVITVSWVQEVVATYYGLDCAALLSKKRHRDISFARQVAMYLARELTTASLPEIGKSFGGRDHTTVLHACHKVKELMAREERFAEEIAQLKRMIRK